MSVLPMSANVMVNGHLYLLLKFSMRWSIAPAFSFFPKRSKWSQNSCNRKPATTGGRPHEHALTDSKISRGTEGAAGAATPPPKEGTEPNMKDADGEASSVQLLGNVVAASISSEASHEQFPFLASSASAISAPAVHALRTWSRKSVSRATVSRQRLRRVLDRDIFPCVIPGGASAGAMTHTRPWQGSTGEVHLGMDSLPS
mmetsp:Transcript_11455/g.33018  ORF Transcript_11455/g.33018 Transcript_11455/m.33018 type:complete len:201 (-) Transcript_11455:30-632(-)